jgi:hypothetical protein
VGQLHPLRTTSARPAPRPRAGWIVGTIVAAAAAWAVGWLAGVSWAWRETTPSLTLPGAIVARMLSSAFSR